MRKFKAFFVVAMLSLAMGATAALVPSVIAFSADGEELYYEVTTVKHIKVVGGTTPSMTVVRQGTLPDVVGVRAVAFGEKDLLPTALQVGERERLVVDVFPNPVQTSLRIRGVEADADVQVYNLDGRVVLRSTGAELNVSSLEAGNYFLKVKDCVLKFIKK